MKDVIVFLQGSYSFKISRMISKFLYIPSSQQLFYLGTKQIHILSGTLDDRKPKQNSEIIVDSIEFLEGFGNVKKKLLKKIDPPNETIKIFSNNLFKRLKVEECRGDFCKYSFLENKKGFLRFVANDYPGQGILNYNHKLLGSIYSVYIIRCSS